MNRLNFFRQFVACACAVVMLYAQGLYAQGPVIDKPSGSFFWRSYKPPLLHPTRMTNTERIHSLMRGGKLYLTLQDAVALAIENDLNLEVGRNGPLSAHSPARRRAA
jgi:outer membrane protein